MTTFLAPGTAGPEAAVEGLEDTAARAVTLAVLTAGRGPPAVLLLVTLRRRAAVAVEAGGRVAVEPATGVRGAVLEV